MAEIKYEIIRKTIQKEIESGKYQVGDKLPTESNLMETFGVSRYTVRRAISISEPCIKSVVHTARNPPIKV